MLLPAAVALLALQSPPPAAEVLAGLELMSFPNSARPSRAPGRVVPADWGFGSPGTDGGTARVERPDPDRWVLTLSLLRRTPEGLVVCFTDRALNGGSYHARSALLVQETPEGRWRAVRDGLEEPACQPMPRQG